MTVYEKKSKVGKKGEIYTDKEMRKIVGLRPEDEIYIFVKPGTLIVKKVPTLKQLLTKEPITSITIKEFEEISEEMQKKSTLKGLKKSL